MRLLPLLVGALLLVTGCGGTAVTSGSSADEVAGLVPATVPLLAAFETDPESEQWQQADGLLDRFPGRDKLFDALRKELADEGLDVEEDVVPALGDETYLALLDFEDEGGDVVVLTQPRDKAKLDALLEESDEPLVTREVDGWTLIAESEAVLDTFTAGGQTLADASWFQDAQARVEEPGLVTFFVNGQAARDALQESLPAGCELPASLGNLEYAAGLLAAEDDGVRLRLAAVGDGVQELLEGESLFANVPAGAFAYLGAPGFDPALLDFQAQESCKAAAGPAVPDLGNLFGVNAEGLSDLFTGGFAFYAKSAAIIPEATLLLAPEDEAAALATIDELAESLAEWGNLEIQRRQVGDVEARAVALGPVTLLWGAGAGKVVVTTSPKGFDALTGSGDGLDADDDFRSASDAAGVGEGDEVFVYLDVPELIQLAEALAGLSGETVPPEVAENLEPLESLLVWGDRSDPDDVELGAFLAVG
jgi:hypothetical protein